MTEDWIRKHFDAVNWDWASEHGEFSYAFMREFADYLDFNAIMEHRKFNLDFIREFKDKIDMSRLRIDLKEKILEEYVDFFDKWEWEMISQYTHLTKKFCKKYADKLDWYNVILHQKGIDLKFRMNNMWRCSEREQQQIRSLIDLKKELGREFW